MAIGKINAQARLDLANAAAKVETLVRRGVQEAPVNFEADTNAALASLKTLLDAAITAS